MCGTQVQTQCLGTWLNSPTMVATIGIVKNSSVKPCFVCTCMRGIHEGRTCETESALCILMPQTPSSLGDLQPTKRASLRLEAEDLSYSHGTPWRFRGARLWQSPQDSRGPSRLFSLTTHISSMGLREPKDSGQAIGHNDSLPKQKMPHSQLHLEEFAWLLSSAILFYLVTPVWRLSHPPNLWPILCFLKRNWKARITLVVPHKDHPAASSALVICVSSDTNSN